MYRLREMCAILSDWSIIFGQKRRGKGMITIRPRAKQAFKQMAGTKNTADNIFRIIKLGFG